MQYISQTLSTEAYGQRLSYSTTVTDNHRFDELVDEYEAALARAANNPDFSVEVPRNPTEYLVPKRRATVGRCRQCEHGSRSRRIGWAWRSHLANLREMSCPRCGHFLSQTTLALQAQFWVIPDTVTKTINHLGEQFRKSYLAPEVDWRAVEDCRKGMRNYATRLYETHRQAVIEIRTVQAKEKAAAYEKAADQRHAKTVLAAEDIYKAADALRDAARDGDDGRIRDLGRTINQALSKLR